MIGICDFCGKEKVLAFGNGFHGCYCADCIRLNIQENKGLLKTMRPVSRRSKGQQPGAGKSTVADRMGQYENRKRQLRRKGSKRKTGIIVGTSFMGNYDRCIFHPLIYSGDK